MSMKQHFAKEIARRKFLDLSWKGGVALVAAPALLDRLWAGTQAAPGRGLSSAVDPQLLDATIRRALVRGGDYADVYVEHRTSRQVIMEEAKFRSAVVGISQGAGVRVIAGDKTGYAYADEITAESLGRAADVASLVAVGTKVVAPVNVQPADRPSYITIKVPLTDVADSRRLEVIQRANQAALDYDARIKMAFIDYYDEVRGRTIATSEGVLLSDDLPLFFFIVQTLGVEGEKRHMSRERLSRHSGFEIFEEVKPEDVARAAARESIAMLEARDCPAGIMDVVIQNGWGGVLVHEAVGHPLEADNIAKKIGVFTGKLGQKVASDVFTMVDDGTLANARGTTNFDDEGTPMKRNVLIQNGRLEKYMSDVLSAKQLGMERTGNGRRESFRYLPIPRMTNTFIDKGTDKPEAIIASTPSGLYVQSLSGGSVNPVTGMFNFTCREAYLIENGRKTAPVRGATLIGSCMDIIQRTDAVADDLAFGPGICGKGQAAEVSAGQPTVRIRGINVGGSKARG